MELLFYIFLLGVSLYFIWNIIKVNIIHPEIGEKMKSTHKKHEIKLTDDGKVICPLCKSTQIQLVKRGWKITTGFIGSSKLYRVCMQCKHKFK